MTSGRASVVTVQRSAIERALVDGDDARRYLALAGMLDAAVEESETFHPDDPDSDTAHATASGGVLSAALLSLALVPHLDGGAPSASVAPPATPWTPGREPSQSAVRRGAELALQWFDVSAEQVATRAEVPTAMLTRSRE